MTQQNKSAAVFVGGGTGGPPDKDMSMYSQSDLQ